MDLSASLGTIGQFAGKQGTSKMLIPEQIIRDTVYTSGTEVLGINPIVQEDEYGAESFTNPNTIWGLIFYIKSATEEAAVSASINLKIYWYIKYS